MNIMINNDNNIVTKLLMVYFIINDLYQNSVEKGNQQISENTENETIRFSNCQIESTEDLIDFGKLKKYVNGIPKIIHYVYKTNYIPVQYSSLVKHCMEINKDAKFVFWSDFSVYRLVIKHFSDDLFVYNSYLNKSTYPLKLADVNRYFILLKCGGIYMDLDTECQKPFEKIMVNNSCILSKDVPEQSRILWNYEYLAMNSLMACVPDHSFFKYVLKNLNVADKRSVLDQTGPFMLTNLYENYSKHFGNSVNKMEPIALADAYVFSPLADKFLEGRCQHKEGGKWRIQGCKDIGQHRKIEALKQKNAIVVHLFMHLGYEDRKYKIQTKEHICLIVSNMTIIN